MNDWRAEMGLPQIMPFDSPIAGCMERKSRHYTPIAPVLSPSRMNNDHEKYVTGFWTDERRNSYEPDKTGDFFKRRQQADLYRIRQHGGRRFRSGAVYRAGKPERTNQRAVLSAGWGNDERSRSAGYGYAGGYVPHGWLFKRYRPWLITAAPEQQGRHQGRSALNIIPFGDDQPYWGERVYKLGIGPKPILRSKLNADNFAYPQLIRPRTISG